MSEVNNAYPVYDNRNELVKLYLDSQEEVKMKQMIAEFAILANSKVAEYISTNLKERHNIYRSCELRNEDKQNMKDKNGNEIIEYIVSNAFKYWTKIKKVKKVNYHKYLLDLKIF